MDPNVDGVTPEAGTPAVSAEDAALAALDAGIAAAASEGEDEAAPVVGAIEEAADGDAGVSAEAPGVGDGGGDGEAEAAADAEGGAADPGVAPAGASESAAVDDAAKEMESLGLKNEKSQARFRELWEKSKRLEELEPRVRQADELIQSFEATGTTPEQARNMLGYLAAINRGGIPEKVQAYEALSKELEWLGAQIGKPSASDPFAAHADLKDAVESGEISRDRALELAELRGRTKAVQTHHQETTEQRVQQVKLQAGKQSLNDLEASLKAQDPGYMAKREVLIPVLRDVIATIPPRQWAAKFKEAYDRLPAGYGAPAPAPVLVPRPAGAVPLRSAGAGAGAAGLSREPASPLDALEAGLAAAQKGAQW